MLPSPIITSSTTTTTPFSVKDILKHEELQQQTQQHQQQHQHQLLISRLGFTNASAPHCALQGYFLAPHSPPACMMLAGRRDSPSPSPGGGGSGSPSDSEDRMATYLSTLEIQERLADSGLPRDVFTSAAAVHHGGHQASIHREDVHSSKSFIYLFMYYYIVFCPRIKMVRHVGFPNLLY